MKKLHIAIFAIVITGLSISSATAGQRAVNGMLIGAGSGAVLGQAIGRDTESTIAGTVVGGITGLVIGTTLEHGKAQHVHYRPPAEHVYYPPPKYKHKVKHHRPHYAPPKHKDCTKTVKITKKHGVKKRVVTTKCYERHHNHRPHYRHYPVYYR